MHNTEDVNHGSLTFVQVSSCTAGESLFKILTTCSLSQWRPLSGSPSLCREACNVDGRSPSRHICWQLRPLPCQLESALEVLRKRIAEFGLGGRNSMSLSRAEGGAQNDSIRSPHLAVPAQQQAPNPATEGFAGNLIFGASGLRLGWGVTSRSLTTAFSAASWRAFRVAAGITGSMLKIVEGMCLVTAISIGLLN